jgi:hypothetical protein
MKKIIKNLLPVIDIVLVVFAYPSALIMFAVRRLGISKLPLCKKALLSIGVFPIRNHYYEPQFDMTDIKRPFSSDRNLPGVDLNIEGQLEMLKCLNYSDEIKDLSQEQTDELSFYLNNPSFQSGDAEFLYQLIRFKKPKRIFEIGSGYSTLMARDAIRKNKEEDAGYECKHVCIEPYEMPWLEKSGVIVRRDKVEDVSMSFFSELSEDDLLFIDSSHMIRPDGDVLFEFLELLPQLSKGVIVHVHDIFTPRNYLDSWLREDVLFWNEQYLLEAFLSNNDSWKVIGALNYLHHNQFGELIKVCPYLSKDRDPGSFYIQKIS